MNLNERNRNLGKPVPGCLGRMVNLFELNTSVGGNRMLTEKPHYEGSSVCRSQSDVSSSCVADGQMYDKVMVSEVGKSRSNRKTNVTPIKMLIAQEMSKEETPKKSQPNLVAKLMGLDDIPQSHQIGSASCRSNPRGTRSRSHSISLDFIQHDEVNPDVFEIWQQSCKTYGDPPQKDSKYKESKNEKNMAVIREKFLEVKRMSTDEKLRQSKQFQDALEVLNSNKELFLEFLQEPNSLFSQHDKLQSLPPRPDSKRITVLKPSKFVDDHMLPCSGKENGKKINEMTWNKFNGNPSQPTRIVVLKPNSEKPHETTTMSSTSSRKTSNDDGFFGDLEDNEPIERTPGYIGDESSFSKSEVYYAAGNLSDSEVMSPTSRHSWDYINRFGSPYSSSFSRVSYSPESSVVKEAKKRLSERWAIMSLNGSVQEQRHVRRNSSTLGEMLALSDMKKSIESQENCINTSDLNKNKGHVADSSPTNLVRSNSGKKDDNRDLTSEKSQRSSFSRLFLSRSKQKSQTSDDEARQSSRNFSYDGSQCVNDVVVKDVDESLEGQHLYEGSENATENNGPSPISVFELQLEDDDHTSGGSLTAKLRENGIDPNKFNLIDKSPPIGSVARTVSRTTTAPGKTSTKSLSPEEEEHECFLYVQTLLSAAGIKGTIQSDSLTTRWHSPESPLDPSLRDKYMSLTNNEAQPLMVRHTKQRHQRSFQKLVFDCVNEALTSGTHKDIGVSTMDYVWGQIKKWVSGEERCVWYEDRGGGDQHEDGGDTATLVVQRMVGKEVLGEVWVEHFRLELDGIKREIEEKLVEQLVDEYVLELRGRVILDYTL